MQGNRTTVEPPAGRTTGWIRRFHPAPGAGARLVCLPHAGASAAFYHELSRALSPETDVLAVQYPGRADRRTEPFVDSIDAFADLITDELSAWTDRPLALFGHSMGATIAFEVASRLEQQGIDVVGLLVSGRQAPSVPYSGPLRHLGDDTQLLAALRQLDGTDDVLLNDPELLELVLPVMRSDYRAIETYRYSQRAPLRCPVTALTGDADPVVRLADVQAWERHTENDFRLNVFAGGHFYLVHHADAVTRTIREYVERTAPRSLPHSPT